MINHRILKLLLFSLIACCSIFVNAQPVPLILGLGEEGQTIVTTSSTENGTSGEQTLSSEGFLPNPNAASRFLSQAATGPTYEDIIALSEMGLEDWLDVQLTMPRGFICTEKVTEFTNIKNNGLMDPNDTGAYLQFWDYAYWEYMMTSEDVLRQRVALALSEILVVSQNSTVGENAYAFASYYDLLLDHALGNYYDLLKAVTFHPVMGTYLTYMNNPKKDTIYDLDYSVWPPDTLSRQVIFPDENYAREVMQLFTIGLCELEMDGTCKTDANGVPIPTYDNVDIAEFAKIFTGLTWGDAPMFPSYPMSGQLTYTMTMKMFNEFHEQRPKYLLNGEVIEQRPEVDGIADIEAALNNLFQHPNIGPFIGKLLIQRLVTSNPSPAYIARVAKAFNGESAYGTVRGDMKAIIKAILLDEEARNCAAQSDDSFGRLREPFNRYVQLSRSFKASNENGHYRNAIHSVKQFFGQKPFTSPSVFNFFQSDYQPIGPVEEANLVAPEFQITNSLTIAGYMNALNRWLMFDELVDDWGRGFEEGGYIPANHTRLNFTDELTFTDDAQLPALIDRLDLIIAHGALSQRSKALILQVLQDIVLEGAADTVARLRLIRVKMAVFLIMSNPEYLINR